MTFLDVVAYGLVPTPTTKLNECTFRYSSGAELTLTGESAQAWHLQYVMMLQTWNMMRQQAEQAQQIQEGPRVTTDALRQFFGNEKKEDKKEDKKDDTDKEK